MFSARILMKSCYQLLIHVASLQELVCTVGIIKVILDRFLTQMLN